MLRSQPPEWLWSVCDSCYTNTLCNGPTSVRRCTCTCSCATGNPEGLFGCWQGRLITRRSPRANYLSIGVENISATSFTSTITLIGDSKLLYYKSSLSPKITQLEQDLSLPASGSIFLLFSLSYPGPTPLSIQDWLFFLVLAHAGAERSKTSPDWPTSTTHHSGHLSLTRVVNGDWERGVKKIQEDLELFTSRMSSRRTSSALSSSCRFLSSQHGSWDPFFIL